MKANHRTLILALAAALAAALGAGALAQPKGAHPHHGHGPHHGHMTPADCPHGACMHGAAAGQGACPLLSVGAAQATVENTKNGAVIRVTAKDPARVADLQRAAASIAEHINAHAATAAPPAAPPSKP
jgi:hypothetical protein